MREMKWDDKTEKRLRRASYDWKEGIKQAQNKLDKTRQKWERNEIAQ